MPMIYPDDEPGTRTVILEGGVTARRCYPTWDPAASAFPLTPIECWYVMQGWAVLPASRPNADVVLEMPGEIEMSDGFVMLRQT